MSLDLLNEREKAIVARFSGGLTDRKIAEELYLSRNTIRWYNRQIYSKLGVKNRTEAIAYIKDLAMFQSSASKAPPPFSRSMPPAPTLLFVGRSRQMADIKQLLHVSRLLTLTGTGGTGKTQLALRVVAEVADTYPDGVYYVDLASLSDHRLVAPAIASALGILEQSNIPLLEALPRVLAGREMLLLLDNFEQVIQAAPLLLLLLASSSCLKVLVTSREPLRLCGEQEYFVPPLSLPLTADPSVKCLTESEAGLLFVRRVQMVMPHFELREATAPIIGRICIRLDGVPLALELAAARCKLFTLQKLLEELEGTGEHSPLRLLAGGTRHAPPRQRTLRGSIAWSYQLLEEEEQRLLARLAVFRGGCSLAAIERICGEGLSVDVLDGLASLVDKHLVQQKGSPGREPRFVMLAMIQEYARERLHASGEEESMRRQHAQYFVELAERAEPELRGTRYHYWSEQLEMELENMRAAFSWSLKSGEVVLGVQLAGALGLFWYGNGHHMEGRHLTQQLLTQLEEVPLPYHPRFLLNAGHLVWLSDLEAGKLLFHRALAVAREVEDQIQTAWALAWLGNTLVEEPSAAMSFVEEALTMFRELKHLPGMAMALNIMGEIARFGGDDERARRTYEECLVVAEQTGEQRRIGFMYQNLTYIALHAGETERARDLGQQGLLVARASNNRLDVAKALAPLAGALVALGQPQQALRFLAASQKALERLGVFHQPWDQQEVDAIIACARAQVDEVSYQIIWKEGRSLTLEQAVAQALNM